MFELAIFQSVRTAITLALGVYLAFDLWRLNRAGPAFAIQQILTEPDGGRLLVLQGRKTGFVAWIYTRLGLEADARLELTALDIRIERQSLKGFELFYAPTHDLSCSKCSYYRAVSFVLIAVALLLGGFMQLITAWQIDNPYARQNALAIVGTSTMSAAVGAIIAYWLFEVSKRIFVSVTTTGSKTESLALKRNVIDNVTVGLPESLRAVGILNKAILDATTTVRVTALGEGSDGVERL
jgi:hypothetical protein